MIQLPRLSACWKVAICFLALSVLRPAVSQGQSTTTTLCFRGRTITVPSYLASRYEAAGATVGGCGGPVETPPPPVALPVFYHPCLKSQ